MPQPRPRPAPCPRDRHQLKREGPRGKNAQKESPPNSNIQNVRTMSVKKNSQAADMQVLAKQDCTISKEFFYQGFGHMEMNIWQITSLFGE